MFLLYLLSVFGRAGDDFEGVFLGVLLFFARVGIVYPFYLDKDLLFEFTFCNYIILH